MPWHEDVYPQPLAAVLHVCMQVNQAKGAFTAQLLLQVETYLLLHLTVLQLTASIPDSYPGVRPARDVVCLLDCEPLYSLCRAAETRCVKQEAYTGPQLALQLLPSPPRSQALPQQQQQQQRAGGEQQQQEQHAEWGLVAPTAPLLTQLLPLLTRHCLAQLQQEQQRQQQQQEVGAAPTVQPPGLLPLVHLLVTLLVCSVVPAPDTATAEGLQPPPPLPPAAAAAPAAPAEGHPNSETTSNCLYARGAYLPHADDITSILEGGLRLVANYAAAATAAAAAAAATAVGATATAAGAAASAAADAAAATAAEACGSLWSNAAILVLSGLRHRGAYRGYKCYPPPLVNLALAAGPGSQVQRQLYSLLTTLVKLSGWGMLEDRARLQLCAAVTDAALVLLADAAEKQQQQAEAATVAAAAAAGEVGCSSDTATAVLPSVFLLGRCCMTWAELLQANSPLSQTQQQQQGEVTSSSPEQQQQQQGRGDNLTSQLGLDRVLSVVQQWLQHGSTCDQLAAAGYAPQAVLQQLEQVLAAWHTMQLNPSDTATLLAAAQQLQSTGLALCSFAVPCMCNNPGCTSMAGLSELVAVSGRSCICAGCLVARYCGRVCQRAAWKQHKPVCGALRAAAGCSAGAGTKAEAAAAVVAGQATA
jgi:hypothetical protein